MHIAKQLNCDSELRTKLPVITYMIPKELLLNIGTLLYYIY